MTAVLLRLLLSLALVLGGTAPASAANGTAAAAPQAVPGAQQTTVADATNRCGGMAHARHAVAGSGHADHAGAQARAQAMACCHGSDASGTCSDEGGCAVRCLHAPPMLAPPETRVVAGRSEAQPAPMRSTHAATAGFEIPIRPPIA
jgi:hypothetical protein